MFKIYVCRLNYLFQPRTLLTTSGHFSTSINASPQIANLLKKMHLLKLSCNLDRLFSKFCTSMDICIYLTVKEHTLIGDWSWDSSMWTTCPILGRFSEFRSTQRKATTKIRLRTREEGLSIIFGSKTFSGLLSLTIFLTQSTKYTWKRDSIFRNITANTNQKQENIPQEFTPSILGFSCKKPKRQN